MLAKVVKKDAAAQGLFTPFLIPEIGEKIAARGVMEFVFSEAVEDHQIAPAIISEPVPELPDIEEILQQAQKDAAQIIAQAEEQSAIIEQITRDRVTHEIRTQLQAEMAKEADELRRELTSTIERISSLHSEITAQSETDLVELALEIAKKVVGREVTLDREVALTLTKISLAKLHNRTFAKVHLHPEDFVYLQNHLEKIDFHGSLELIEDRSISLGGCLIRTETGDIDARLESQFDEIAYGLLGKK